MASLKEQFPLRLIIGNEDATQLLDSGFTFSNTDPGGFEAASFSVPRDLPQTLRGQYVRLDCGLKVAWEGRVSQVQRSLGSRTQINCEGYGALLKDLASSMVFVDRDLSKWGSPATQRQINILTNNQQLGSSAVSPDPTSASPSLIQTIQDSWAAPWTPTDESWYDAGPLNLIAAIYYSLTVNQAATGTWSELVRFSSDSIMSSNQDQAPTPPAAAYFTPAIPRRYVALLHNNSTTPAGVQGATYNANWANLALYGNHGLTRRGSDPGGFYPSDIVGWVEAKLAGLGPGVIQQTDASNYIVPHSVYYTPVSYDQIISDMATAQGWHWGVWESLSPLTGSALPRLDFRPRPGSGAATAFCHRSDCDMLDMREDLSQQYNQAVVNFTDVAGTPGSVTVSADNPILDQAGIQTRTVVFSAGTMTSATATIFGAEALAIISSQARVSGSADILVPIDQAGPTPAWLLRAGIDRLRIGDIPSTDAFGTYNDMPISRVEASISSDAMTTMVELGSGANLIETLQARLASATALSGA